LRMANATLRRRLVVVLIGFITVFMLLIGRLAYLQLIKSPWLTELAENSWKREVPVQAIRGTIYDRNDSVLAYNGSASTVMVVPVQVKDKQGTAGKLAQILGAKTEEIEKYISKRTKIVYLGPKGKNISDEQAKTIRNLSLPGVYITEGGKRLYPNGELAAHVLGFTGADNQGLAGVESVYDTQLKGQLGKISFYANAKGQEMPGQSEQYTPPVSGEDMVLTIDKDIQSYVEREIQNAVAQYNPDGAIGIVANPKTGEILAMANYPTYNPQNWQDYPSTSYDRNLAIWKTFEPGSTFKIATLAAALQENKVNLKDSFHDPGYYEVAGHKIKCWKAGGHGSESFLEVVENSCNPGFIVMGERLGKSKLFDYIKKFGFGTKTGIDLPGEGNGIMFKPDKVGPLELATTSFGQGVSVTPIQQVMAVSAIANGGKLMKPYVVKEFKDHDTGQVISQTQPTVVRQVVSPDVAAQVRSALESVVAKGTGKNAYREGFRIAGKTGTAQVVENGRYSSSHYIVSFIGMAPANDPQLVAYIAIDYPRPKDRPVFGGQIAAPIIGHILADSLIHLGYQPTDKGLTKEYSYLDRPPVTVPNLMGLAYPIDLQKKMMQYNADLKVEIRGSGDTVIAQKPSPGTKVNSGTQILLYLGNKNAKQ
jgi:stage V sporulation protein D (sporulation-specific penicillin-binding protein)